MIPSVLAHLAMNAPLSQSDPASDRAADGNSYRYHATGLPAGGDAMNAPLSEREPKMAANNTPLPWQAHYHFPQKMGGRSYVMLSAVGSVLPLGAVVLGVEGCGQEEGRANAALIVRAVNSHEALVKALEFYADGKRYNGANHRRIPDDPYTSDDAAYMKDVTRDGGDIARRALAAAKGPA